MRWIQARLLFLPTLMWNLLLGRALRIRNWWDRVDEQIILGARPFRHDVQRLYEEGIRAVVNTCEEYAGPVQQYARLGIVQLRVPTVDFQPPTLESINKAVAFMDEQIAAGNGVYVHCKAGRARSATVVLCWLVKNKGLTPTEAQALLLEARPHVYPRLVQRQVVQDFWSQQTVQARQP